jgi:ComF family protein
LKPVRSYIESFIALFFPRLCLTCDTPLQGNDTVICAQCMLSLPETGFHTTTDQPVMDLFNGRIRIRHAMALLFFDKGSKYRRLIYQLKYNGRKEAGLFLGKLMGSRIRESIMPAVDYIIPVPLHRTKLRRRGFNQSAVLAQGISSVIGAPVIENALVRRSFSSTQTRKGRFERWQNVEGIFECRNTNQLCNKHLLLVDDVVTTGATLEAAGSILLEIEGSELSVAAAAYAVN